MRDLEGFWEAPQEPGAVWQVALFLLPMWIEPEEGGEARLAMVWTALCLDLGSGEIAMSRIADAPEGSLAVDALPDLARRTGSRPERIQVSDLEVAAKIRAALEPRSGTETRVELRDDLLELRSVYNAFREHIAGNDLPGYLTVHGVTVERMAAFAQAAAGFFAAEPWHLLGPADLIEIEAPDLRLRLYLFGKSDEKGLLAFLSWKDDPPEEADPEPELPWSLIFVPADRIALDDLELWARHGLPRARPALYPFLFYPHPDEIERPDAWQLSLFEGLLRLFAGLTQEEVDRGELEREVETADGPIRLQLRIPGLPVSEGEMEELAGQGPNPRRRAEGLLDDEHSGTRRSALLARRALEIWPDCALAYVALGGAAQDRNVELGFFHKAVAAGRHALGDAPEEATGYLTALYALGDTLHAAGRSEEAVEPLQELLRLDPLDPGKARYLLVDCLLRLGRHEDLQDLLGRYRDASAFWSWPRALLAFRLHGDSPASRDLLQAAVRANPYVPQVLSEPLPGGLPSSFSRLIRTGSEEEALAYAIEGRTAWEATPGALEWLASRDRGKEKKKK